MHIVFINYSDFIGNSGLHIHPLANELVKNGHLVTVIIPNDVESISGFSDVPLYKVKNFGDSTRISHQGDLLFVAWTPREDTRKKTIELANEYRAPYIVHLEDNEELILSDFLKTPYMKLQNMNSEELEEIVPGGFSHPHYYRDFLAKSIGVTCIIKSLEDFVPKHIPAITFWPSCENSFFKIVNRENDQLKEMLGIPIDADVIFYPGNIHTSNVDEVSSIYQAIEKLNSLHRNVYLLRCGLNHETPNFNRTEYGKYIIELGSQPIDKNIDYISLADILVQPGIDNQFNRYRFPSKLPMFLASGRPVITGETNLGVALTDWENCIKFVNGDSEELAHKISLLLDSPDLARSIGLEGKKYAIHNFSWEKSAAKVSEFYIKMFKHYRSERRLR